MNDLAKLLDALDAALLFEPRTEAELRSVLLDYRGRDDVPRVRKAIDNALASPNTITRRMDAR